MHKVQLSDRDHIIAEQHPNINKLQMSIDRNESYSRRSNLIFGGISKDAQGSCINIVQNIMSNTMNIPQAETITFVKCHYLNQPTSDKKGSIIARFENFSTRMNVWSKRKSLLSTEYYLSEDYPKKISRKRGKLRPILKEASKHRDYARCISIKYDQLNFKGELMNFDDLHKLPLPINPRSLSERRSRDMLCFGGVLNIMNSVISSIVSLNTKTLSSSLWNKDFSIVKRCCLVMIVQHRLFYMPRVILRANI